MPEPIDPLEDYAEPHIFGEEFEGENEEPEEFLPRNTKSFICLLEPEISRSSIFLDKYYYFPEIEDPDFEYVLWGPEPVTEYDNFGMVRYKELCKQEGIIPFRVVLKSLILETLDLRYYGLTESEAKSIFGVLGNNLYITTLLLEENFFSPESLEYLVEALQENNNITTLSLKHCRIGIEGARVLGNVFMQNSVIQDLDLSFNGLGDDGFLLIADGIRFNTSIRKLNLSHNELGSDAFIAFRSVMEDNFTITDLDLSWNFLYRPKGMRELMEGLIQNAFLLKLNLAWNGIGHTDTVRGLFRYLKSEGGMKLSYLDLSNNRFTDQALLVLYAGMKKNKTITVLKIRNNPIRPYEVEDFARLLIIPDSVLEEIDFGDVWVEKSFIPLRTKIRNLNKTVLVEGIYSNFKIKGPNVQEVLLKRVRYIGLKPKKKKLKNDYGTWLLGCEEDKIEADKFKNYVKTSKIKLDPDLIKMMTEKFSRRNILNLERMKEVYLRLYPDTKPPPPKRKGKGKGKKGKGKKGKKGKKK